MRSPVMIVQQPTSAALAGTKPTAATVRRRALPGEPDKQLLRGTIGTMVQRAIAEQRADQDQLTLDFATKE